MAINDASRTNPPTPGTEPSNSQSMVWWIVALLIVAGLAFAFYNHHENVVNDPTSGITSTTGSNTVTPSAPSSTDTTSGALPNTGAVPNPISPDTVPAPSSAAPAANPPTTTAPAQ